MFESLGLLSLGAGGWGGALLAGAGVTMALALACVPLGLPLGLLVALCSKSPNATVRAMAVLFSTCFRGLPELLTLLIVYSASRSRCRNSRRIGAVRPSFPSTRL